MPGKSFRLNQEHVIGFICIAISLVILSITPTFPKGKAAIGLTGPSFFPNLLALVYVVCGIYQLWYGAKKMAEFPPITFYTFKRLFEKKETQTAYLVILMIVGFILLFDFLGFILTTYLFLFLFMRRLGVPVLHSFLYSLIFTGIIYFLFGWLFTISLPSGILSYIGL